MSLSVATVAIKPPRSKRPQDGDSCWPLDVMPLAVALRPVPELELVGAKVAHIALLGQLAALGALGLMPSPALACALHLGGRRSPVVTCRRRLRGWRGIDLVTDTTDRTAASFKTSPTNPNTEKVLEIGADPSVLSWFDEAYLAELAPEQLDETYADDLEELEA